MSKYQVRTIGRIQTLLDVEAETEAEARSKAADFDGEIIEQTVVEAQEIEDVKLLA